MPASTRAAPGATSRRRCGAGIGRAGGAGIGRAGRAVSQRPRAHRRLPLGDAGSAVVEFSLVAVLLLMLLLAIVQVGVYLHIRNVATASAAEGARYAANADASPEEGAARTKSILVRGLGEETAARLRCSGGVEAGPADVQLSVVRCSGSLPVFFAPVGDVLAVDVTAHAVEEAPSVAAR